MVQDGSDVQDLLQGCFIWSTADLMADITPASHDQSEREEPQNVTYPYCLGGRLHNIKKVKNI